MPKTLVKPVINSRWITVILLLLCALTTVVALMSKTTAAKIEPIVTVTQHDTSAEMSFASYPVKKLDRNRFQVKLTDSTGNPASGYTLSASLTMPDMGCGVISFPLTEVAPGSYEGITTPWMAGRWETTVTAIAAGTDNEQVLVFTRKLDVKS